MATSNVNKIRAHIRRLKQAQLVPATFNDCIIEQLGHFDKDKLMYKVNCYLEDNKLVLQDASSEADHEDDQIRSFALKHPPYCPFAALSDEEKSQTKDVEIRGVDVGVVVLLESSDGNILLTRRAPHMRTFPGVWVPPGGHIELNETLEEAGLRELSEETGLLIPPLLKQRSSILALWESTFPPSLVFGPPKRHHIVVYLLVQVDRTSSQMEKDIKLNPNEVDASFWMPLELADSFVEGVPCNLEIAKKLQCISLDKHGEQTHLQLDPTLLLKKMPHLNANVERVSTGTQFAIEMWYAAKNTKKGLPALHTQKSNL